MNSQTLIAVLSLFSLLGFSAPAIAAERATPSTADKTTRSCATRQDYVNVMLKYEEQLKKDPFNHAVLKQLVSCHEAMLQEDRAVDAEHQRTIESEQDSARQELPDLPDLAPENGTPKLAAKAG